MKERKKQTNKQTNKQTSMHGSHPAEAVGFLGRKNPQHAFLRKGSKAVGPMP